MSAAPYLQHLQPEGHRVMVVAPRYAEYDVTPVDQVMFYGPLLPLDLHYRSYVTTCLWRGRSD